MGDKRYTAQEMREASDTFWVGGVICEVKDKDGRVVKHIKHDAVIAMLRQAADAEDELASVKARLAAVVKECGNAQLAYKGVEMKIYADSLVSEVDAILRAARGES